MSRYFDVLLNEVWRYLAFGFEIELTIRLKAILAYCI
jgi:hypothetical protein